MPNPYPNRAMPTLTLTVGRTRKKKASQEASDAAFPLATAAAGIAAHVAGTTPLARLRASMSIMAEHEAASS